MARPMQSGLDMRSLVPLRAVPLLVLASLAAAGCGESHVTTGDGGLGPDVAIPGGSRSFVVTATITAEPSFGPIPETHVFTMWVDSVPASLSRVIAGASGSVDEAEIRAGRESAEERHVGPLELAVPPIGECGGVGPVRYEGLALIVVDVDGDGLFDSFTGTARGTIQVVGGDIIDDVEFTATLVGVLDREAPRAELLGVVVDRNPVDGVYVRLSEPLQAGTRAALIAGTTRIELTSGDDTDGPMARFFSPHEVVLPPGTTLSLQIEPFVDLAGNPGSMANPQVAIAPLAPLTEGGFEREVAGERLVDGLVEVATRGTHAVIAGDRSVALLPSFSERGGRVTLRVPLTDGASRVSLSYRVLRTESSGGYFYGRAQLRGNGASGVSGVFEQDPDGATLEPSGFEAAPEAGPMRTLSIDVPDGVSGEVLLDLDVDVGRCGGLLPPPSGLLIDDVRAE